MALVAYRRIPSWSRRAEGWEQDSPQSSTGSHHRLYTGRLPERCCLNWSGTGRAEAGFGNAIGSLVGGLIPSGPYVAYPIIVSMYKAGASLATVISFVTGWMLWSTSRLPFELALFGPRFSALRMALYLVFPPLVGLMVLFLWS